LISFGACSPLRTASFVAKFPKKHSAMIVGTLKKRFHEALAINAASAKWIIASIVVGCENWTICDQYTTTTESQALLFEYSNTKDKYP